MTLSGAERVFDFDPQTLVVSLDMRAARAGWQEWVLTHDSLEKPVGLTVQEIEPRVIRLRVRRLKR